MSEMLPYTAKVLRRLRRNLRLFVADWLLRCALRAVPADMHNVRLAVLEAQLTGLDAMDFSHIQPPTPLS